MSNRLGDKVAVVTGASKGIGAGIARGLAEAGASVIVNYASDRAGADRVVAEIAQNGGKATAVEGDEGKKVIASTPLGRLGTPADTARVVVFLASDDSAWVTGEVIRTSGGMK